MPRGGPAEPLATSNMNEKELNWRDMTEMPAPGSTVLIHIPKDDEPVWFGFWDGRRWHYIEGLPVRSEVRHWCQVPTPPRTTPFVTPLPAGTPDAVEVVVTRAA